MDEVGTLARQMLDRAAMAGDQRQMRFLHRAPVPGGSPAHHGQRVRRSISAPDGAALARGRCLGPQWVDDRLEGHAEGSRALHPAAPKPGYTHSKKETSKPLAGGATAPGGELARVQPPLPGKESCRPAAARIARSVPSAVLLGCEPFSALAGATASIHLPGEKSGHSTRAVPVSTRAPAGMSSRRQKGQRSGPHHELRDHAKLSAMDASTGALRFQKEGKPTDPFSSAQGVPRAPPPRGPFAYPPEICCQLPQE